MKHDEQNHHNHLCEKAKISIDEAFEELVKDPKFVCTGCGRVANEANSVCSPREL